MTFLTGLKIINEDIPCKGKEEGGLDKCPLIWKDFHDHGYATAYAEDSTWISTFNYLKKGFKNPPTDHYFRPYFQCLMDKLDVHTIGYFPFCLSYKHGAEYVFDYMMDFVRRYKGSPYFGLFWVNSFSHDDANLAYIMDQKTSNYLKHLEEEEITGESVIIFLSDHGLRFGAARQTKAGAIEENLPFLNIWIPPKLRSPDRLSNLRSNQNQLLNPYDLYHTIFDVLAMSGYEKLDNNYAACSNCTSIFNPILTRRTCQEIGIPSEFCSCKDYKTIPPNSKLVFETATTIVKIMNGYKNSYNSGRFYRMCKDLSLGKVSDSYESIEDAESLERTLFVNFNSEPNNGLFEVAVTYPKNGTLANIKYQNLSIRRINSYANDSRCIQEKKLLNFCYCGS